MKRVYRDLISVIVPVYNISKYLPECIDSIIGQTYTNLQIILVDDGSTDDSGKICDMYKEKDDRIIVVHKENGGLSDARNVGLDLCDGKYISFIDSDDWIESSFLEELHTDLVENQAQICAGGFVAAFKSQSIYQPERCGKYTGEEALCKLIENIDLHDHVCTKLFLKELWEDVRFPVGKVFEDIRTTYKVFLKCQTIYVNDKCLYWYRQRGTGIARGVFNKNKLQMVEAVEELALNQNLANNDLYKKLITERLIRVKCFILRDVVLNASMEDCKHNKGIINDYIKNVRKYCFKILKDKSFPSSIKLIALISGGGIKFIKLVFNMPIIKNYYLDRYEYFE